MKYYSAAERRLPTNLLQMLESKCHIIMILIAFSEKMKIVIQKLLFPLIVNHFVNCNICQNNRNIIYLFILPYCAAIVLQMGPL